MAETDPRYIIGIDLGTTNSAVGYVDLLDTRPDAIQIEGFEILQLVGEGRAGKRLTLPSFLYLPDEREQRAGYLSLPWDMEPHYVVGEFARQRGLTVPGRLVSSAKSWLCHGGVDRRAKILPWGGAEAVEKVSPVDASSAYLKHIKDAWDSSMDAPMEEQEVVLTVPASFDEVARELTLEAARGAGLERVTLLEEPLAAFYSWLSQNEARLDSVLEDQDLVLVCDIGGGTTDFTLVRCLFGGKGITLERVAVGDHLLLGGDNMDLALAATAEKALGRELDHASWQTLLHQVRALKERLLEEDGPETESVRIAGKGRGLVAGTITARIKKAQVLDQIIQGFFPEIPPDEPLDSPSQGTALREMGLPYCSDPAVTRHLLRFLKLQGGGVFPTAVLFNGGALKPRSIRKRLLRIMSSWSGKAIKALESVSLDLAISRGAAYYGLSRRGLGLMVGGGIPRAYYIGVETGKDEDERAVCLVERGTEEGREIEVKKDFKVIANQPVSFKLFSSTTRKGDRVGDIVSTEYLHELPHLNTVLRYGKRNIKKHIPVHLMAMVTAIGTLEIFCISADGPHRWRLQFDLRAEEEKDLEAARKGVVEGVRIRKQGDETQRALSSEDKKAVKEVSRILAMQFGEGTPARPLSKALQEAVGMEKRMWRCPLLRAIFDLLVELEPERRRSARLEAQWFNLMGYTMRPGLGDPLDAWRMKMIWPLWFKGLFFPNEKENRLQWWIFWRRVAGGLSPGQQEQVFSQAARVVMPQKTGRKRKKGLISPKVSREERRQVWFLIGSLEKISPERKAAVARFLLKGITEKKAPKEVLWLFGKLGARHPFYGPIDRTVPPQEVGLWLKDLRKYNVGHGVALFKAVISMARMTGDRTRDLTSQDRKEIATWLQLMGAEESAIQPLLEVVPPEAEDRTYSFGEELPQGLILED